jgi:serine/threonine-protein kinase
MSADGPAVPPAPAAGSRDALHNLCLADPVWAERYEGWTVLGHGGSASVVRTFGKALGEELALKIFPRLSADEWRRFREEVRNALRLSSPYIVRTYSPFPRGSFAWIELELVDGTNLRDELERRALERRPFRLEEALAIGHAVTGALVTAHDNGVTHRDVKPANVLLPRDGRPAAKLGDFGISRLTGAARLTQTGLLVGTPQFAAPEVVAGRPAGPPADVYSLALCLYLLFSNNRPPFEVSDEASPAQWLKAHADHPPRPIGRLNPSVPAELASLLAQGLAKDPAHRPTAHQVLERLGRRGGSPATVAAAPTSRSSPRDVVWLGVAAAIAAGLGAFALWSRPVQAPEAASPEPPSPPTLVADGDRVPPTTAPSTTPSPASPAPTFRPAPLFQATLRGELLTIRNSGAEPVADLRVALVGDDGRRHLTRAAEGLAPGQQLVVAFEDFSPVPAAGARFTSAEIEGVDRAGVRRTMTLPLR